MYLSLFVSGFSVVGVCHWNDCTTRKSIYPISFYCVLLMVSVVGTIVRISKFIDHFLFLAFLLLVSVVGLIVQTPKSI